MNNVKGVGSPVGIPRKSIKGSNASVSIPQSETLQQQQNQGENQSGNNLIIPQQFSRKTFRRFDIDLTIARTSPVRFAAVGTIIWVANATDEYAELDIILDIQQNDAIPFLSGTIVSGIPFSQFWIKNDAQAGKTVTIMTAQDSPLDRLTVGSK